MVNRLYRSESDKKVAGVCGGIADYFGIDPTIIRLIWLISIAVYGTGLLVYIIAAIVMPTKEDIDIKIGLHENSNKSDKIDKQKNNTFNENSHEEKNRRYLGYVLIIAGVILLSKKFIVLRWLSFKFLFPIILIILEYLYWSVIFKNSLR